MKTTFPKTTMLMRAGLCIFIMLCSVASFSQNTAGRDFWLAQTPNLSGTSFTNAGFTISVSNLGTAPANITITNPVRPPVTAVIQPNTLQMFNFSSENENIQATGLYVNNVYHVTSDKLVVVNSYEPITNVISNDGALIFPTTALGKRHIVASYVSSQLSANGPTGYAAWNSFYSVVANENATNVKVYNTAGILIDNVNLNQGQCYQRMNGTSPANDVTGYYIEATKKVSVFSGTQATAVGTSLSAQDHIYEQVLPVETLSNEYIAAPSNNRPIDCVTCTEDLFRYVATEDNTVITTTPNVGSATLNKGQYLEVFTNVPHIVTGTKPFYGHQYLTSQRSGSVQGLTGDPDLIGMPVVDQFLYNTVFAVPNTFNHNFITITAPVGTNLTIDDTVRTPTWRTIGVLNGVTYQTTSIKTYPGSHRINADKKIGFFNSSFSPAASISYMGGSGMEPINAGCITGGPYLVTTCVQGVKQVQLNGTAGCSDKSTPTSILWESDDPNVIFSDATIANPIVTVPQNGRYNITMTVNCSGNTISCSSEIIVSDPIGGCASYPAPTMDAPPYLLLPTDNGQPFASGVNLGSPIYTSTGFTTITNDAPAQLPIGTTVITWTLKDALDRVVSDTQHVTVFPPPTITAPADVTVSNDAGVGSASNVALGDPVYKSHYDPTSVTNTAIPVYPVGSTTVTYSITDGFGRTASDVQVVTVVAAPPTIAAPPAVTVNTDAGQNYATGVALGNATYTVSVDPATLSNDAPAQFPIGNTTVTWTVKDGLGRTASATQVVTVVAPPPTIVAPPAVTVIAGYNGVATGVNLKANGNESYTVTVDPATVSNDGPATFPMGTTNVTWTVTDGLNRTASDVQQVIVVAPKPIIDPMPNITVSNNPGKPYATGVNLGTPTFQVAGAYTLTNDAPAQFPLGSTTVTWTLKDSYGNTVKTSHVVTVTSAPPTIVAPPAITVNSNAGQNYATNVTLGNATYTVSVDPAVLSNNAPAQFPLGNTTVTWTVKDGLGRTASASQVVTVVQGSCSFNSTISSIPTSTVNTGGNPNRLYLGYGAQSTKLQANVPANSGGYTFTWTGSGLSSYTSAAPIFSATNAGSFTFTCKAKNNTTGCTSTSTITICVTDARSLDKNGKWDGKKVIVCHLPPGNPANVQYIDVSINAVPTHVPNHGGDGLGNSCTQTCNAPTANRGPVAEAFGVNVYPNPTAAHFVLQVKSDDRFTSVSVRIMDAFGRTVSMLHNVAVDKAITFGEKFASGAYYAEVIQGENRKLIQLVKTK